MEAGQHSVPQTAAFSIARAAILACLLMNAAAAALVAYTYGSAEPLKSPETIAAGAGLVVAILMLAGARPFEFLLFFAFSCAGFFGYTAYCEGSNNVLLPVAYWLALGLLTRRMNIAAVCVAAACAVGLGAVCYLLPAGFCAVWNH